MRALFRTKSLLLFPCSVYFFAGFANASVIDVSEDRNQIGDFSVNAASDTINGGFPFDRARDNIVRQLPDGSFDGAHMIFSDGSIDSGSGGPSGFLSASTYDLLLDHSSSVEVTELVVYVQRGPSGGNEADRNVTDVAFWVNQGTGLFQVASKSVTNSDDVGNWERVSVGGHWDGVTQIGFNFTPASSQSVRVGEILATNPEPETLGILGVALLMSFFGFRRRLANARKRAVPA